ncbi:c-type cytochrome [Acetobacter cerevisiae]|nr:cytochrome c [Acetobacter cerevisiae]GBQ08346.1 cytochrome c precursor [Acetobacter cerevisiae DSM 14362]
MMRFVLLSAGMLLTFPLMSHAAHADTASGETGKVQVMQTGEAVYHHVCQSCHMPDGKGARNAAGAGFPALANNARLQDSGYPIYMILNGRGGMPWFSGILTDKQVADVANYVRSHFGNHWTDTVSPQTVEELRPTVKLEE